MKSFILQIIVDVLVTVALFATSFYLGTRPETATSNFHFASGLACAWSGIFLAKTIIDITEAKTLKE